MKRAKVIQLGIIGFLIGVSPMLLTGWDIYNWQFYVITLPFCAYVGWSLA